MRTLLLRGLLAGLIAGLAAFGFARVVGEPPVRQAIAFEQDHADADADAKGDHASVGRDVQSTVGLATGTIVLGVALGGIFALVFAFSRGRLGPSDPRASAAIIAVGAFVCVYLVPFLKYPASPPAFDSRDSIGRRTILYFLLIDLSVLITAAAITLWRRLRARFDAWDASIVTGLAYAAAVAVTYAVMPSVRQAAEGFPATLLWRFRLASFGVQAVMWATIGLVFGALTHRALTSTGCADHAAPRAEPGA